MKKILFAFTALGLGAVSMAQTVRTYAGMQYTGSGSYTGYRNNHKDSVLFSAPMGIEVDTSGRLYVSNEHNLYWIQGNTAYLAAGYLLDPADPGAADSKDAAGSVARFSRPAGLSVNPNTNEMMICDLDNNQIRKMEKFINTATQQIVSTFAGVKLFNGAHLDGASASAKFNGPLGIAVASNGDVYIADRNNHCIRKISNGTVSTIAGQAGVSGKANGTGSAARFYAPSGLFINGTDLLVADYGNGAIRKINLSTYAVTDLITTGLFGPKDLCVVDNVIYIAEAICVKRFENNVLSLYAGSSSQQGYTDADGTSARFEDITGIVYHPKQKLLYVVDMGNNVVRSISPNARPVCSFTTSTTTATKGQTIILKSTSSNKPDVFRWTITPSVYSLLNGTDLNDSLLYVSFPQAGTYSVKLYVSNMSGADSLFKSNHIAVSSVTAIPVADFTASNTTPSVNEVISLIDMSQNSPTSWKWRISPPYFIWMNGTDSTSKIPNVKFTNGNNFTITLIATNASGSHSVSKPDYVRVNGTGLSHSPNAAFFTVYPNPASSLLYISSEMNGHVSITDVFGRVCVSAVKTSEQAELSTDALRTGTYFLIFKTAQGTYTEKVIVNH